MPHGWSAAKSKLRICEQTGMLISVQLWAMHRAADDRTLSTIERRCRFRRGQLMPNDRPFPRWTDLQRQADICLPAPVCDCRLLSCEAQLRRQRPRTQRTATSASL
jgi:hypothetical protein